MRSRLYIRYLHTTAWHAKRQQRLAIAGGRCEWRVLFWRCKERHALECHHRTYRRLGNERMSDLAMLCKFHHGLADRLRRARVALLRKMGMR